VAIVPPCGIRTCDLGLEVLKVGPTCLVVNLNLREVGERTHCARIRVSWPDGLLTTGLYSSPIEYKNCTLTDPESLMISTWLSATARPAAAIRCAVTDVVELGPPTTAVKEWLGERLRTERVHPQLVEDLCDGLGWQQAFDTIKGAMPSVMSVRKGVVGELLATDCAISFDGCQVPVKKLRSMIVPGESLHGTDVLAFRLDAAGEIEKAYYVESKLRLFCDRAAAVEAEKQLHRDMAKHVPDILLFVANQMYTANTPLVPALRRYMRTRTGSRQLDEFRISLTFERSVWSEDVLTRLVEADELLAPLSVWGLTIDNLDPLIAALYEELGFEIDPDDD